MIGGLQGEFGDLDIKYLKQNISKNVGRKYREASGKFRSRARGLQNFAAKRTPFRSLRLISQPCEICLQLGVIGFQWL